MDTSLPDQLGTWNAEDVEEFLQNMYSKRHTNIRTARTQSQQPAYNFDIPIYSSTPVSYPYFSGKKLVGTAPRQTQSQIPKIRRRYRAMAVKNLSLDAMPQQTERPALKGFQRPPRVAPKELIRVPKLTHHVLAPIFVDTRHPISNTSLVQSFIRQNKQ